MGNLLSQNLKWHHAKESSTLLQGDNTVLKIIESRPTKMLFEFDGKSYSVKTKGFWKPFIVIEENQSEIVILKHSLFGSKASIEFNNGNKFKYDVKNSPLVNINFYTNDELLILNYKLESVKEINSLKTQLEIYENAVSRSELIMLTVLGFYLFRWIEIENVGSDLLIMSAGT